MQGIGFAIVGAVHRLFGTGPYADPPRPRRTALDDEIDANDAARAAEIPGRIRALQDRQAALMPEPFEYVPLEHGSSPAALWTEAGGDRARYLDLMRQHGYIVTNEPCPTCGERFRHRHTQGGAIIRADPFGHDCRDHDLVRQYYKVQVAGAPALRYLTGIRCSRCGFKPPLDPVDFDTYDAILASAREPYSGEAGYVEVES